MCKQRFARALTQYALSRFSPSFPCAHNYVYDSNAIQEYMYI